MAGSVFKRGEVWTIRYELPRGPHGERRQKMVACRGMTKRQAEEKLRQILSQIHNMSYAEPATLTVAAYLARWLDHKRSVLGAKTHEEYTNLVMHYIAPRIGHYRLDQLRPLHIQNLYADLLTNGRLRGEGGLSPKTVRNIHGLIHAALEQAVRWQMLPRNVASAVEPPRPTRPDVKILDQAQIPVLLEEMNRCLYRIPFLIVLATGMRRGEAVGLSWEDLDADRRLLTIRRSISYANGRVFAKETKTGRSRIVLIPEFLLTELQAHRKEQRRAAEMIPGYRDQGWICADGITGDVMNPLNVGHAFRRLAARLKLPISLHSLRHTQATQLIMAGVPVKVVSERLGHANTSITQDIYSHVLPHMQGEAVAVIDRLVSPPGAVAHTMHTEPKADSPTERDHSRSGDASPRAEPDQSR